MKEPVKTIRHSSELGSWEAAIAAPHPSLRPFVRQYFGGSEITRVPIVRREIPSDIAPVIINFGPPTRIFDPADQTRWTDYRSFATGAFDQYALAGTPCSYSCVQVNLTILGMRLFLGRPLGDLCNRVVALEDLFGASAERLASQLYDAPTWDARFDILDREIAARIARAKRVSRAVVWTWQRLVQTGGRVSIGTLVSEAGCSQKHLIAQFNEQIGLTPKVLARVLRFSRAAELLKTADGAGLADIALECGYYDQSHFSREFRAFAGVTPTELVDARLPDSGGYSAEASHEGR